MNSNEERFLKFIMKEKTRNFFALAFYVSFIVVSMGFDLPLVLERICYIVQIIIMLFGGTVYICEWLDKTFEKNRGQLGKNIIQEIKKLAKEILMFIPIFIISILITSLLMDREPANENSVNEFFYEAPIFSSIYIIIIGPIIEEIFFRFLPYRFIKNKALYIIVSTVIFAAMHVNHDPNPFYNIWFYMMRPLYYGYRYHKTKDLWVPISIHMFNNLIATLPLILSKF